MSSKELDPHGQYPYITVDQAMDECNVAVGKFDANAQAIDAAETDIRTTEHAWQIAVRQRDEADQVYATVKVIAHALKQIHDEELPSLAGRLNGIRNQEMVAASKANDKAALRRLGHQWLETQAKVDQANETARAKHAEAAKLLGVDPEQYPFETKKLVALATERRESAMRAAGKAKSVKEEAVETWAREKGELTQNVRASETAKHALLIAVIREIEGDRAHADWVSGN
jgi:hypothetical protein